MSTPRTLDDSIVKRMVALKEKGDTIANRGDFRSAIPYYKEAWKLIPEPREDWKAATWILGIIGDAYFLDQRYQEGYDTFMYALRCPGAISNPFIHLRLGQCALELGHKERAKDELMLAYMSEGQDIFLHDDPKYLEFLAQYADVDTSKLVRRTPPRSLLE